VIVQRVTWPRIGGRRPPFDTSTSQSPLRLTLHQDPASPLLPADADALALLREFSEIDKGIDIIDTQPGNPCSIEFTKDDAKPDSISAVVKRGERTCSMDVWTSPDWPKMIEHYTNGHPQDAESLLAQLLPLELHRQQYRDVFATNSQIIQKYVGRFLDANVRSFGESLRFLALQLRTQNSFPWRAGHRVVEMMDRERFYSLSASVRMPALGRLWAAWAHRARQIKDESEYLGMSPHSRCARALRALDEIGFEFYAREGERKRQLMTYHFDYLTMLLAGAVDAQGRMAHAIFTIKKPGERNAAFHHEAFVNGLRAAGATHLVTVIESERCRATQKLLWSLRNTIHGVGLTELGMEIGGQARGSVLRVHGDAKTVVESAQTLGGPKTFGLSTLLGAELEPYQCAVGLVETGFEAINNIAAAIQLDRPELSVDDEATLAAKLSFQEQETNAERRRRVLLMG
jgi:hypothetical protein